MPIVSRMAAKDGNCLSLFPRNIGFPLPGLDLPADVARPDLLHGVLEIVHGEFTLGGRRANAHAVRERIVVFKIGLGDSHRDIVRQNAAGIGKQDLEEGAPMVGTVAFDPGRSREGLWNNHAEGLALAPEVVAPGVVALVVVEGEFLHDAENVVFYVRRESRARKDGDAIVPVLLTLLKT